MLFYILFAFALLADASSLLGETIAKELRGTYPLLEAFESFLLRSLDQDGSLQRYLLISANVVPPPPTYETQAKSDSSFVNLSQETRNSDLLQHFKIHVEVLLNDRIDFINAFNKVLAKSGELLSKIEASQLKQISESETSETLSYYTDESKNELRTTEPNLDESETCDASERCNQEQAHIDSNDSYQDNSESEKVVQDDEEKNDTNDGLTTGYINFLTEGLSSEADKLSGQNEDNDLMSEASVNSKIGQNELNPKATTENNFDFLQTDSIYSSTSSSSDDYEIELTPIEQSSDISTEFPSTQFVKLNTDGYNHVIVTELPSTENEINDRIGLISTQIPLEELKNWLEENPEKDVSKVSQIEFHDVDSFKNSEENFSEGTQTEFYEIYTEDLSEQTSPEGNQRQGKQLNQFIESKSQKGEISPKLYYIPGTPGDQFPNYDDIPDTRFACGDKNHIPGFYADQETRCQVFHVCWPGRRESFLCPLGTIFNQAILACDYWYNSNCSIASAYYDVNAAFKEDSTTAPMVDTLIKASEKEKPAEVLTDIRQIDELFEADVHFSETLAKEELSQIWKFLPIKAKVFIEQPPPEFKEYLARLHKQKRSEDDTTTNAVTEPDHTDSDYEDERVISHKETIQAGLIRVLKNLMSSTKVEVA